MQVYIGIDWSQEKHEIVFHNEDGQMLLGMSVEHSMLGLQKIESYRQRLGVEVEECIVGIETAHHLLIDFLWKHGYSQIYVLPPNQVRSSQGRRRQSSARNDRKDADLIAEILRTDRHRLYPWHPGSDLLQQMRAKVSLVRFLTMEVVRTTNRLRDVLLRYYPAALSIFSGLNTQIALAFIQAYPTPSAARGLGFASFQEFAQEQGYRLPKRLPGYFAKLQQPQPEATPTTVLAFQEEAVLLSSLLSLLVQAKAAELRQLQQLYEQHPDHWIFDSLPMAGTLISAGLLVKFGEDRQRFPSPQGVQALAGTCPVTNQSGKSHLVRFRKACDKDFRYIVQEWARATVNESVWATNYYLQIRPHSRSDNHAYRCLANRWLAIVWRLWHDQCAYQENLHLQRHASRCQPRP